MHGMTFHEAVVPGLAIAPQVVQASDVDGNAIVNPWQTGRKLTFVAIAGALGASDAYTTKVQARRKGTTTWDDVQDETGAADLTFTASKFVDGGEVENGAVIGTVDLGRLKTGTGGNLPPVSGTQYEYDALRLTTVNADAASTAVIGFSYFITDLFTLPATTSDELLFSQIPQDLA